MNTFLIKTATRSLDRKLAANRTYRSALHAVRTEMSTLFSIKLTHINIIIFFFKKAQVAAGGSKIIETRHRRRLDPCQLFLRIDVLSASPRHLKPQCTEK